MYFRLLFVFFFASDLVLWGRRPYVGHVRHMLSIVVVYVLSLCKLNSYFVCIFSCLSSIISMSVPTTGTVCAHWQYLWLQTKPQESKCSLKFGRITLRKCTTSQSGQGLSYRSSVRLMLSDGSATSSFIPSFGVESRRDYKKTAELCKY